MSALPPKANIYLSTFRCPLCAISRTRCSATKKSLLNHLVSARNQASRNFMADRKHACIGTVSPSAVVRLMTNSNLVIAREAGFARMVVASEERLASSFRIVAPRPRQRKGECTQILH
jgi:hypothetical protein